VSRIKLMASLDIVERRLPQDGRSRVNIGHDQYDLRVSAVPAVHGEDVVIRILPTSMLFDLDRLGLAFPREEVPKEPLERLEKVRRALNEILPTFQDSKQVTGMDGEFWSPRKVLRRALWHERDHTDHILKLL
jgi:hypothetical protein